MSSNINAGTQLSDVIVPEVFFDYQHQNTMENIAYLQSGVMRDDPRISAFLAGGGTEFNIPVWNDLLNPATANISSDTLTSKATYDKVAAVTQKGVRLSRNKLWASADLTGEFAGSDPMKRIANRVGYWWAQHEEFVTLAVSRAIIDHSVAGGTGATAGDLVHDIYSDVVSGSITAANLISPNAVLDTWQTSGDAQSMFDTIAVHSVVANNMRKANTTTSDFVPASQSMVGFDTYLGKRLVIDDSLTVVAGTNSPKYYTYMYRSGALAHGSAMPRVPVAITRDEEAGDGGGAEGLVSRRIFCVHPQGYKWVGSAAGDTPTNAELQTAGNWARTAAERKQVGIACLLSNG